MKKLFLLCFLVTGCATAIPYQSGASVTSPVQKPLAHAQSTTQQVLTKGAIVNDPMVVSIATDLNTAQNNLLFVTNTVDSDNKEIAVQQNTITKDQKTISAKDHRILIDDIIFAIPLAIVAGMIFFQIAKVVAL